MNARYQLLTVAISLGFATIGQAQTRADPNVDQNMVAEQRAEALVDAMTLDEQIGLLTSESASSLIEIADKLPPGFDKSKLKPKPKGAVGSAGFVPGIERLGLPALQESDASLGVSNFGFLRPGDESTALPSLLSLASAFDRDLAYGQGQLIGAEAHAKGFNVQLAGGVNLARDPRNGRNFEYPGEDPLLGGTMAGAQVAGIQSQHVISTVKHFALNGMETGRTVQDARIDEGALRESDLLAFQIAIEEGQPGAVMCAYNKVNSFYSCQSPFLLNKVLKGEWGFKGWVMSDWGAVHGLEPSVVAGLDQQSPQGEDTDWFGGLKAAVASSAIPRERVHDMALRIVGEMVAKGVLDDPAVPNGKTDVEAHARQAQTFAESGMVLLKNNGGLPLASDANSITIIGGNADRGVLAGGGSSEVSPYGGRFRDARGATGLAALLAPGYGNSSPMKALQALRPQSTIRYDDGSDPARAATLAAKSDVVLIFAVKPQMESLDSPDLGLPYGQDALIEAVAEANANTVVVLETGNPVVMPWLGKVRSVLEAWYPGQRGGEAIAALLDGQVAPSGRLPITFPANVDQLPRPVIPGFDPANRLPFDMGGKPKPFAVAYTEGSDVGYRWFLKTGAKPLFPFGYGLTYTDFRYADLRKPIGDDAVEVVFTLENIGAKPGTEVAQLYVAPPNRSYRLAGWVKLALQPGERRRVGVHADSRVLASWAGSNGWQRDAGTYRWFVGSSAGDPRLSGAVKLKYKAGQ